MTYTITMIPGDSEIKYRTNLEFLGAFILQLENYTILGTWIR